MCSLLRSVICSLSSVGKMKFTVTLSRLLQLSLYHLEVFNSSGCSNMAGYHSSLTNPLSFPDVREIPLGKKNFCSACATQLLTLKWSLLKQAQELPLLRKGPSSHSLLQGCVHLLATFHHASVHTVEDIQAEWIWNFSFPFFLCFPSGNLILSA